MQRLKSLRRSISSAKSSRRRSGASLASSSNASPRQSTDTGASATTPSSSIHDLTSSPAASPSPSPVVVAKNKSKAEEAREEEATEATDSPTTSKAPPPEYRARKRDEAGASQTTDEAAGESQDAPHSLTTSVTTDPPVIVEPPTPSPTQERAEVLTDNLAAASGREAVDDSPLRHRMGSLTSDPNDAAALSAEEELPVPDPVPARMASSPSRSWVVLAIASGAFAALNGVFAKLTTADLTSTLSHSISSRFNLDSGLVTPVVRGSFFVMNLISNAIMWGLFTRALTAHSSATKVSLINTSANFLVTAVLGALIFMEHLSPAWFGGAALLVLGTLIIGRDRASEAAVESDAQANGNAERSAMQQRQGKSPNAAANATERDPLLAGGE